MEFDSQAVLLFGSDDLAQVYLTKGRIVRKYSEVNYANALEILEKLTPLDQEEMGIVTTWVLKDDPNYPYSLQHRKLVVTLPQNWSKIQLRDALLHTISVAKKLDRFELTLKDYLPENIAFSGHKPIFVDFASIVHKDQLNDIGWLNSERGNTQAVNYLLRKMLLPYFFVPLMIGYFESSHSMQRALRDNFCNSGNSPAKITSIKLNTRMVDILKFYGIRFFLLFFGRRKNLIKQLNSLERIINWLDSVKNRNESAYSKYYEEKNENFPHGYPALWQKKQTVVAEILNEQKPKTVLDIGANTGWFSILSALGGAHVIAMDSDSVSIELLYNQAKALDLEIDSLILKFEDLVQSFGLQKSFGLPTNRVRTLPSSEFRVDLVLALGIVHHLCLGAGYGLGQILEIMAQLANECLIIEFIPLEDSKIVGEPSFFPNLEEMKDKYCIEDLIEFGLQYFSEYQVYESNPESRRIIKFWNRLFPN